MSRWVLTGMLSCVMSVTTAAHFVFIVPDAGKESATVMLSETLVADAQVDVSLIAGATLSLRDAAGRETPLTLTKAKHAFVARLVRGGSGLVHGVVDLGVMTSSTVSYVLRYHPKTIMGDALGRPALVGDVPAEIVPTGAVGALRLQLLTQGKPRRDGEITVILPDGSQKAVKTDAEGRTEVFAQRGRYGAWARYWESSRGERQGKAYEQIRHYATLVFDTDSAPQPPRAVTSANVTATRVATLPEATSSFGAVATDGWLYVYGGHIAPTHVYSSEAVSGRFSRLNLADGKTWEDLPGGPPLQGMNLAAHGGKIYRVGGMQPQNRPGDPQDVRSVADVARFDPSTRRWESLPSLPTPRSSHDVAVVRDRLFVVGGWTLKGNERTEWPDSMDVLDLSAPMLSWKRVPQPFKRRALITAARNGRVFVLGGFNEKSQVVHRVEIYDVRRDTWSSGPNLPGGPMNGFGPAACAAGGDLYVSVEDGGLYRLNDAAEVWEQVGSATPRIVHRIIPTDREVLVVGGAFRGANSDLVEAIALSF